MIALPALAGSVRLLDGKTIEGDLRVDNGQFMLISRRGESTPLDLNNVLNATFHTPRPVTPLPSRPKPVQKIDPRWRTQDVGPTGTPGSVAFADGRYSVVGAGANIKGAADSFFFVYQELRGDGQIVARLGDLQLTNPDEKAGVMIREKFNERGSKCAFMYFKPQDGSSFAFRGEDGGEMAGTPAAAEDRPPAWLKLKRQRGVVTAYKSIDGESWTRVGLPQDLPMEQKVYAGLAVCSRDTNAACVATFDGVAVQPAVVNDDPPPRAAGQLDARAAVLTPGVVLRSGAVLGNVHIESADDQTVKIVREGKPITLATSDVARLVLAPVNAQQLAKVPPTGSGVLLARGDFMEGEFASLAGGRVKLNSIVFGPADLMSGAEARLVALHDVSPTGGQAAWVVRTNEGYVYMAKALAVDGDSFVFDDEVTGPTRLRGGNVAEITAGGGRYDLLGDLRPDKVDVPAGASTVSAYTTPDALAMGGKTLTRPLVISGGSALEYNLDGKYRVFLARAGVADGVMPLVAVRLVVLVDGKEIFRTPAMTGFDESASVAVSVAGGMRLTLRVEAVGDAALPVACVVAEGSLIK